MTERRRPATLDEVARAAGVSTSAVSRSYTPGASVSPATRAKVEQAARHLGYRPNLVARSLSRGRNDIIAIATTRLENSFHAELLQALSLGLRARGYGVLLFIAPAGHDADPCVEDILRHQVRAIALCAVGLSSHLISECATIGVPVVMVNRATSSPSAACIVGENRRGSAAVAAFLLACGHRRFGFITGTEDASTSFEREDAFRQALVDRGIEQPQVEVGAFAFDVAGAAARRMLGGASPPDAIFCANDHMALAVMTVATREFGLELGRALSVVGFDDTTPARIGPGLTTFSQPAADMADLAVDSLGTLLDLRTPPSRRVVEGRLVVRGSSRVPAQGCAMAGDGALTWTE